MSASEYLIRSGSETSNFVLSPIQPSWILEGNPVARLEFLSSSEDGTASTYFWDCTAGRFNWFYSFDETLHIIEGSVTLKSPSQGSRHVVAGDVVFFPKGSQAEWHVDKYIRKLAFCRTPEYRSLTSAKRAARRIKGILTGNVQPKASGLL